jgi:ABC-type branched-subunit amino acid transport system permease subunit
VVTISLPPDVLYDLPSKFGQDFNLSAITSGIYGAILLVVMLLRPYGVMPTRRAVQWSY